MQAKGVKMWVRDADGANSTGVSSLPGMIGEVGNLIEADFLEVEF